MKANRKTYWGAIITFLGFIILLIACEKEPPQVTSISVKTPPSNILYKPGELLSLSGLVVTLEYDDGEIIDVPLASLEQNNIITAPGDGASITSSMSSITITHTTSGKSTTQALTVNVVTEIIVKTPSTVSSYLKGELLDLNGLIVTLKRQNGDEEDVNFTQFIENNLQTEPDNGTEITEGLTSVSIIHNLSSVSVDQNISICTVSEVRVLTAPTTSSYYTEEYFSLEGLSITLLLSNDDTRELDLSDFTDYGITTSLEEGDEITDETTELIIEHQESGKTASQSITILVLTDIDGNTYDHLRIGDQIWMVENLNTTTFSNGDNIPTTATLTQDISEETEPIYQWAYEGNADYAATYGRLYTQYVASDSRNVCPVGWHVPSEIEYNELNSYLIQNNHNWDGSTPSNKLAKAYASTSGWNTNDWAEGSPGYDQSANNSSGFNGLPAGGRINFDTVFSGLGSGAYWWTCDENNEGLGIAQIVQSFVESAIPGALGDVNSGRSIRCKRDSQE